MKAIMYHYVRHSNKEMPYFRYLSFDNFIKQLDYFDKEYGILSYDEFIDFVNCKTAYPEIKDKIWLTFDDGFADHYEYVLPELLKRGKFGFFYMPTGVYNRKKALDVHRIHFLLGKFGGKMLINEVKNFIEPHMLVDKKLKEFKTLTYIDQDNDYYTTEFKRIFNYYISYDYREALLDKLVSKLSSNEHIFESMYMSVDNLIELHKEKMIIGSHSVNHLVFSKLSRMDQEKEIKNSFSFLEKTLGKLNIKTFCYPYGGFHTFTNTTEEILNNEDCLFSFNVEHRDLELNDFIERPQALPRYDCNYFPYGRASFG